MIRFMVAKPKQAIIVATYFNNLLSKLNEDTKLKCSSYESIGNEMKIKIDSTEGTYFLTLSLNTYDRVEQLKVFIEPKRVSDQFDAELHRIKIYIKNLLGTDWEKIIWLYDEQSIDFAEKLYGKMYRAENQLRSLINQIMITYVGIEWWEKFSPMHLKDTYKKRFKGYKILTQDFRDVEDRLMAIDTDDLKDIMTHTVKQWSPQYSDEIENLLERDNQKDYGRIVALLRKQLNNERNLWDTLFKEYFDPDPIIDEEQAENEPQNKDNGGNFLENWEQYCSHRNHIAHNKLLDHHAYDKILANVNTVSELIQEARKRFESSTITDEEIREANELMMELQLEQAMYESANVRVFSENRIKDMMQEKLYEYALQIKEQISRDDLEINITENPDLEMFSEVCIISSNVDETSIRIRAMFSELSAQAGDESIVLVQAIDKEGTIFETARLTWINGDAKWDSDESYYVATRNEEFTNEGMEELIESAVDKVNETITNYYEELSSQQYESVLDGGLDPIYEEPCENCFEQAVSLYDSILTVGKCAKCGYQNNISSCMRCEYEFIGTTDLCDSCRAYIASQ